MNDASEAQIGHHLEECDTEFVPQLSVRTDIRGYANRLATRSTRFEAWHQAELVGLVAAYFDGAEDRSGFITSVSVLRQWNRMGIASRLISQCVERARESGLERVRLEVGRDNLAAITLYERMSFVANDPIGPSEAVMTMELHLRSEDDHAG
jgi:ribosomal protein S18 acetylase RimI-like enzyme